MAKTTTKTEAPLVMKYAKVTKGVQAIAATFVENRMFTVCIRRVNSNGTGKNKNAFAIEYLEKKPRNTTSNNRGMSFGYMLNALYDDRMTQNSSLNLHRAWVVITSVEALKLAVPTLSEEQIETLLEFELDSEDRLMIMQDATYVTYKEQEMEYHVAVTEIRESEIDTFPLTKGQRASIEYGNTVLITGGDDSENIVCGVTGEKIHRLTDVMMFPKGETPANLDIFVQNKMLESAYEKITKSESKIDPSKDPLAALKKFQEDED